VRARTLSSGTATMKTRFARCKNTSALCATDKYDLRRRQLLSIASLDALQS
jgi:hypothetical protein